MNDETYQRLKAMYIDLYHLAESNSEQIFRAASKIDPRAYDKFVARNCHFDSIDFSSNTVLVYCSSHGDTIYESFPVHFLWTENWEDEVIAIKERRDAIEAENLRIYNEQMAQLEEQRKIDAEKAERALYRKLSKKYGSKKEKSQ